MPATKTLPRCAHDAIESAIDEAADDDPVILWWDDGGYLRDIVELLGDRHRPVNAAGSKRSMRRWTDRRAH